MHGGQSGGVHVYKICPALFHFVHCPPSFVTVCSPDFGKSWQKKHQILTVGPNRTAAVWSGIGDFDVVWDWQRSRWFMLASKMRGAVSYHKSAAPTSWKKWDGQAFTRENFFEDSERFRDVNGDKLPNGEHPSISWNRSEN